MSLSYCPPSPSDVTVTFRVHHQTGGGTSPMSSCCRPSDQEYQQLFSTYLNQIIQHNTNMLAHLNQLLTSRLEHMEQALPAFMETRKPSDRNILLSFKDANIKARSHGASPACFLWKPGNPQTGIYCFPSTRC